MIPQPFLPLRAALALSVAALLLLFGAPALDASAAPASQARAPQPTPTTSLGKAPQPTATPFGPGNKKAPQQRPQLELVNLRPKVGRTVVIEPVAPRSDQHDPTWMANIDIDVVNAGSDWLRLDQVRVGYTGGGVPAIDVPGFDLVHTVNEKSELLGDAWHRVGVSVEYADDLDDSLPKDAQAHFAGVEVLNDGPIFFGHASMPQDRFLVARYSDTGFVDSATTTFLEASSSRAYGAHLKGSELVTVGSATVDGQSRMAVAAFNASDITPNLAFGDIVDNARIGRTTIVVPGCENATARAVDELEWLYVLDVEQIYAVAGDADCGAGRVAVLSMLDGVGEAREGFNGGQPVIVAHPSGAPLTVAGVAVVLPDNTPPWTYVAAKVGSNCHDGNWALQGDCRMSLTRFDISGAQDAGFGVMGWSDISFPGALRAGVEALLHDGINERLLLGGWTAHDIGKPIVERRWAIAALTENGTPDASFAPKGNIDQIACPGCGGGLLQHTFNKRSGAIRDLDTTSGQLVAGGWALNHKGQWDFAVGRYDEIGTPLWGRLAYTPERRDENSSAAAHGVAFDKSGRIVLAGMAPGGGRAGTARFHEVGRIDTVLEIGPSAERHLRLPDGRQLTQLPSEVHVDWHTAEWSLPYELDIPVQEHETPVIGSYRYPLDGLGSGQMWSQGQHHELDTLHRSSLSQRYAYDVGAVRWDAGEGAWTGYVEGGEAANDNDDWVVYGKTVRAAAGGRVVSCYSGLDENEPGEIRQDVVAIAGGGNMFWIEHDSGEYALYAHMIPDSVNLDLCPENGEAYYKNNLVPVNEGDELGRVGNSGNSTGPHLHFHVQTGIESILGTPSEGVPALFRGIDVLDKKDLGDVPVPTGWVEVLRQAIPFSVYLR